MLRAEDLPLRPKQTRTQAAKRKRRAAFSLPVANAYPSKQETVSTERTQKQGRLVLSNFTRVRFQTSAEKDPSTVGSRSGAGEQAFAKIISPLTHIPVFLAFLAQQTTAKAESKRYKGVTSSDFHSDHSLSLE